MRQRGKPATGGWRGEGVQVSCRGENKLKTNWIPYSLAFTNYTWHTSCLHRIIDQMILMYVLATKSFTAMLPPFRHLPSTSVAWLFLSHCFQLYVFNAFFILISGTSRVYTVSKTGSSTLLKTERPFHLAKMLMLAQHTGKQREARDKLASNC